MLKDQAYLIGLYVFSMYSCLFLKSVLIRKYMIPYAYKSMHIQLDFF